jgi:hypothetical protein
MKKMLRKLLEFDRMHKDKTSFLCFWEKKINLFVLKLLNFQKCFKEKFQRKLGFFNIGSISYSVSLQHDIMQNSWKNMQEARKYF